MTKGVAATLGFLLFGSLGVFVGFLNRPSYLGGLARPGFNELVQNDRLLMDALGVVALYRLAFAVVGGILGALIGKSKSV